MHRQGQRPTKNTTSTSNKMRRRAREEALFQALHPQQPDIANPDQHTTSKYEQTANTHTNVSRAHVQEWFYAYASPKRVSATVSCRHRSVPICQLRLSWMDPRRLILISRVSMTIMWRRSRHRRITPQQYAAGWGDLPCMHGSFKLSVASTTSLMYTRCHSQILQDRYKASDLRYVTSKSQLRSRYVLRRLDPLPHLHHHVASKALAICNVYFYSCYG